MDYNLSILSSGSQTASHETLSNVLWNVKLRLKLYFQRLLILTVYVLSSVGTTRAWQGGWKSILQISSDKKLWLRNPLVHNPSNRPQFAFLKYVVLTNICNDSTVKLNYFEMLFETFQIYTVEEMSHMA